MRSSGAVHRAFCPSRLDSRWPGSCCGSAPSRRTRLCPEFVRAGSEPAVPCIQRECAECALPGLFTKDSFSYARDAEVSLLSLMMKLSFRLVSIVFRGSEPLPRIRSRYPAIPGRCTGRAQSRWKRKSAIQESQAGSDCPSTPASRAGSAEVLPWRRKQIPATEREDGAAKAEYLVVEGRSSSRA